MTITAEERELVATELRDFAKDLNLTDQQKEKLHTALAEARERSRSMLKRIPKQPGPTSSTK